MITKKEVKYIQSLYHKKNREQEAAFIVEGPKITGELLSSNYVIRKVYATEEWANANNTIDVVTITDDELQKISQLQAPNQVLAIAEIDQNKNEPQLKNQLTLILDGIQDPGNLGTIIRIADWFGITQIVAATDTVDVYNMKVIQATMGSFLRVQVWYKSLAEFLEKSTVPVYGALLNGKSIYDIKQIKEGLLVIGNESKGIREHLLPLIQHPVTIPGKGNTESLNAAVATGIILSHVVK